MCNMHYLRMRKTGDPGPRETVRWAGSFTECQVDDCHEPPKARGMCINHWTQWRRTGDPLPTKTPAGSGWRWVEWAVEQETDDCLDFPYSTVAGYGLATPPEGGHQRRVNVLVCELAHGPMPFPGAEAAHFVCGRPICGNKRHLCWATHAENLGHRLLHGTLPHGETHYRARLSEADVREIRRCAETGTTVAELALRFDVHRVTISDVVNGRTWRHLR